MENIKTAGIHRIPVTDEMLTNGDLASKFLSVKELFPGGGERRSVVYREDNDIFLSFSRLLHILSPKDFPEVRIVFCFLMKLSIFEYAALFPGSPSPSPKGLALEPFRRIEADPSLTIAEMDRLIQSPEPEYLWKIQ